MKGIFKGLSLNTKLIIKIISVSTVIVASLVLLIGYKSKNISIKQGKDIIEYEAKKFADINKIEFEKATNTLKSLGNTFQVCKIVYPNNRRNFIIQSLKYTIENNSEITGIGMIWEQNALDGLDSSYINSEGSNKSGKFIPYLTKSNGNISIQQSENFETANWYTISKSKLQINISEPYFNSFNDEEILYSTISIPVFFDGNYVATIYANVSFEKLMQTNNQLKLFKSGYGQLVSNNGTILTHPLNKYLNQKFEDYQEKNINVIDAIDNGKGFSYINNSAQINKKAFKFFAPVKIENFPTSLSFVVLVPYSEITSTFQADFYQFILIGFIGLLLLTILLFFIIKSITKPIKEVTAIIDTIANTGNIEESKKIDFKTNDDLDKMAESINTLIDELNSKTNFAKEIKDGKLDYPYNPLSKEDKLGNSLLEIKQSLIKSVEDDKNRKSEDDKRNWATEGLAKFADILRKNNNNIELLSYELIKNLVKYIKANQGGVFLINEENINEHYLELTACFAFDRQKFLNKKILIGEGLVGSCFLEKKSIYITNVPENYINISSGLGDSKPKSVLIVPLKLNDEIFGVIELASFEKIEPYQIEFIEKVAEIIASSISSVRINMKTASLLIQSQEQAEEMKAQEEEMRQNMEELTATQESLAEKDLIKQKEIDRLSKLIEEKISETKQKEFENNEKIDALYIELQQSKKLNELLNTDHIKTESSFNLSKTLYDSVATVLIDINLNIINANNKFLNLIKKNESDLKGKNLPDYFKNLENITLFINKVLSKIKNDQIYSENLLFSLTDKEDSWFKVIFYPYFNENKDIECIITCFIDITEDILLKNSLLKQTSDLMNQIESIKIQKIELMTSENNVQNEDHLASTELINNLFIKEEYLTDGKILYVNNNFEKTYQYQKIEIEGENVISLIPDKSKKEFKMIWDSITRGNTYKGETCRLTKSKHEIWLSSIYFPIIDINKKIQKIVFLAFDISEFKKLEKDHQLQAEKIKEFEIELKKIKNQNENLKNSSSKKNSNKK